MATKGEKKSMTTAPAEWFDCWPELFARRWPESFRGTAFGEELVRMEQYPDDGIREVQVPVAADKGSTTKIQVTKKGAG
jgi:hypothetical protein